MINYYLFQDMSPCCSPSCALVISIYLSILFRTTIT